MKVIVGYRDSTSRYAYTDAMLPRGLKYSLVSGKIMPLSKMALNIDFLKLAEQKRLCEFKKKFIDKNKAGILVGAGVSIRSGIPGGNTLAKKLSENGGVPAGNLITVCDRLEEVQGGTFFRRKLLELLDDEDLIPGDIHQITARTPFSFYLTTNVDRLMERAIKNAGKSCSIIVNQQDIELLKVNKVPVIKFHGTIDHPHTMVFTSKHFQEFSKKKPAFENLLKHLLSASPLIIVGYSASDPNFLKILRWIQTVSGSAEHIIIDFGREHQRKELLRLGCFLVDPGEGKYDLLPAIMGYLANMDEKDLKNVSQRQLSWEEEYDPIYRPLTNQQDSFKPKLCKHRELPPIIQSKDMFTIPQIASTLKITGVEYSKKEDELTIRMRLDDPEIIKRIQILPEPQKKISSRKEQSVAKNQIKILPSPKRKLLGLMAVSALPLKADYFKQFFPDVDWKREIQYFLRHGILEEKQKAIHFPKSVENNLISDPEDAKHFHKEWINVLKPIKNHIDIAIFLAMHYISLKEVDAAIMIISDILVDREPDWWNILYLRVLEQMDKMGLLKKIMPETRLHFYNSMGLCLSLTGNHKKAVKWFLKLHNYGKRIKNIWAIGQSYINCGFAYFENGEIYKAERCYREAIDHGRKSGDKWLLGRSLYNLAMTIYDRNINEANELMREGLEIKKSVRDHNGIVTSLLGYGNLSIEKGNIKDAIKWYRKAEKIAKKFDFRHLHSLILNNLGSVYAEQNNFREALHYYHETKKIAEAEEYHDSLALAVRGEAFVRLNNGEFEKAEKLFRELYNLEKATKDYQEMIAALHNTGFSLIKQKKCGQARRIFGQALRLAKKIEDAEWIYKCQLNSALSHAECGDNKKAIITLRKSANQSQEQGHFKVAALFWEAVTTLLILEKGKSDEIEKAFKEHIFCLKKEKNNYHQLAGVYRHLYQWRWDHNFFLEAIDTLDALEKLAGYNNQIIDQIQALEQKGVCHQILEQYEEAEKVHLKSLKLSRRLKEKECLNRSLNYLGELLRKTNRLEEAIKMFIEAEEVERLIKDVESMISTSMNRAIAIRQLGQTGESEKLLIECREKARKNELWSLYVQAIHGLANNAFLEGKEKLAENRYKNALLAAEKRGLYKVKVEIIQNYLELLRRNKCFDKAIEILEENLEHFDRVSNLHFYYMNLAKIYEEVNDPDKSKAYWAKVKEIAKLSGKPSVIVECCISLAEIYHKEKNYDLAHKELDMAIHEEDDPENKAFLMYKCLDVLLDEGEEEQAKSIFKKAIKIVNQYGLNEIYIDLHMRVGDYFWMKSPRL
ncbi:MAG: tetratricopeptide repeat protein [Candidatus Aminicenantes bacterium]